MVLMTWRFVFVYFVVPEYNKPVRQLFENERKIIQPFFAEEIYNGLIFPRAKQCKII